MTLFKDTTFNALLVAPGQPPCEVRVENTRAGILAHIGGDTVMKYDIPSDSACYLYSPAVHDGEQPSRAVADDEGEHGFTISGPFLIAGRLFEDRLCGLCPEQVEAYRRLFLFPHVFVMESGEHA